jgi:hypothetical protein
VPQYVAIHATFVGIRGKIFQGLGVLLYSLTDGFTLPFLLAAGAFAWSAVQMWRLDRLMRPGRREGRRGMNAAERDRRGRILAS